MADHDFERVLRQSSPVLSEGRVEAVCGVTLRAILPCARIGDLALVGSGNSLLRTEIVGIDRGHVVLSPLGDMRGVGIDDLVRSTGSPFEIGVSNQMIGRVLDGFGEPIDGGPELPDAPLRPVDSCAPLPMDRSAISQVLSTGVRSIDALVTLGRGQRVGVYSGSGVGKSSLLGSIAAGADADLVVVALVGERGREVAEFVDRCASRKKMSKTVVIAATHDAPALARAKAPQVATTIAEHFREQGGHVLLLIDSITRYARALREIGLAAGEPPARRGYPPSVFAAIPRLIERAGCGRDGSITAVHSVLVEGGDLDEPVADETRGALDGHIVLDRSIAERGRFPAIDIPSSISRLMHLVTDLHHQQAAKRVRALIAEYESKRDLLAIDAYVAGRDAHLDIAVALMPKIEAFLNQPAGDVESFDSTRTRLAALLGPN